MTIRFIDQTFGFPVETSVQLDADLEAVMTAQNIAKPTTGAILASTVNGKQLDVMAATVAMDSTTNPLTILNKFVTPASHIIASIASSGADATFTSVVRIVARSGAFDIYPNATPTAGTRVFFFIVNPPATI